jgi:hypothetical protein
VFKRHGRSYVRCTACRAECTDKASRSVVRDGDGWGRDDENDVANTGTYDLEAVDDGDVVDVLLNLQSDNVASSETVQDASTHRPDDAVEELTVSVADVEHDAPIRPPNQPVQPFPSVAAAVREEPARMGQQSPEESVSNAVAAAQHSVADDVVTCMSAFSGRFTTSFISHLLSHFRTDLVQSEDPDPIADMEQSVSSASERQVQSSESSSSSSLSDCSLSSMDSDENNTDVLPHTFHNAESLDPSILGTTPLKLLIETVAMKDATCVPDIDGYRLLLSKGVELQHDIKVRYTPQDIEYRPTSVSFKIGSHRVSGRKLLFYRIGKVADIDCKVFVCVGFFKEFPKTVHSAARSIHECLCKALCESDSDAPTRELSIRHGNSFGPKGKHTLNRNHCRTYM